MKTKDGCGIRTSKVYIKRFDVDSVGMFKDGHWAKMIDWCQNNLYHGGHYEPYWWAEYPSFYFRDEKEYMMFVLRWA